MIKYFEMLKTTHLAMAAETTELKNEKTQLKNQLDKICQNTTNCKNHQAEVERFSNLTNGKRKIVGAYYCLTDQEQCHLFGIFNNNVIYRHLLRIIICHICNINIIILEILLIIISISTIYTFLKNN